MLIEPKKLLDGLCSKVGQFKAEKPSAGTKFRLMGLVEDILEVTAMLLQEVLEVVRREAVLDADVDIDYAEMAEAVLAWELDEREGQNEEMCELTQKANEALGVLGNTLKQIDEQLNRHHKDEEYVRLYEAEKRRYLNAGTSKRARQKFGEWKENSCYGHPSQEEMEDYRMEKVLHMFEKGVFKERVEHIQRATRYPGELDFEQLDDDNPMKKTAHRHYAMLRKLVDWKDGELVVNPARVGRHFFACRHEANAKSNRTNFLKYMHKIEMLQQERRQLLEAEGVTDEKKAVLSIADRLIKQAIETMMDEGVIKHSYDLAFVMQLMEETDGLPHFDSPNSFLTYISDLGIDDLPSEDSIKKKLSATFGKYPAWRFTDQKGKDATEAKRRNNVASRFLSLYRKGK